MEDYMREAKIENGSYRFDLVSEFDLSAWTENSWGLKRCFPEVNIPAWFKKGCSFDKIVKYDWYERKFIDGDESHEDVFQLSCFKNYSNVSRFLACFMGL